MRGSSFAHASGALDKLVETEGIVVACESPAHARAARDQRARELIAEGFQVKFFETGDYLGPLGPAVDPAALEPFREKLRADPNDSETWHALGDWVIANDPDARVVVEAERAGRGFDLERPVPRLEKRLFGETKYSIARHVREVTWRSAQIIACKISTTTRVNMVDEAVFFADCSKAPALALIESLDLWPLHVGELSGLELPTLRTFRLTCSSGQLTRLPVRWLNQFPRLDYLSLNKVPLDDGELPPHIGTLVAHDWEEALLARAMPNLVTLHVGMYGNIEARTASVLACLEQRATRVTSLLANVPPATSTVDYPTRFVEALARSSALPRLRELRVNSGVQAVTVAPEVRARLLGGAFAHLEHLEFDERYLRTLGS